MDHGNVSKQDCQNQHHRKNRPHFTCVNSLFHYSFAFLFFLIASFVVIYHIT